MTRPGTLRRPSSVSGNGKSEITNQPPGSRAARAAGGQPLGQAGHLAEAARDQPVEKGVPVPATPAIHSGLVSSHHIRWPEARCSSKRPIISCCSSMTKTPPTSAGEPGSSSRVTMWGANRWRSPSPSHTPADSAARRHTET